MRSGKGEKGDSAAEKKAAMKASYQLTNLLVNFALGMSGILYVMNIDWGESMTNKIIGYAHLKYFSVAQVGYQLWALPVGLFFVGEERAMIVHHVSVICVCSVSAFVSCGFRYYTPYFYG